MVLMSNGASNIIRIEAFEPADDNEAYLAAFTGCDECDGTGRREGEAHLTSECYLDCTNEDCCNGEVRVELYGADAEAAHAAWLASQTPTHPLPVRSRIRYGRNSGTIKSVKPLYGAWSYTVRGDNGNEHYVRSTDRGLEVLKVAS